MHGGERTCMNSRHPRPPLSLAGAAGVLTSRAPVDGVPVEDASAGDVVLAVVTAAVEAEPTTSTSATARAAAAASVGDGADSVDASNLMRCSRSVCSENAIDGDSDDVGDALLDICSAMFSIWRRQVL